ncbi:MAG: hypothetical protein A3F09_00620 [Chlamydiae bacterium RIFCSPHIGHO2_12_FULL_49_11]|nr:MAG: hypothetical protein A3F09_00620 [Chlamydiae bacterium RIFCSPHIGHO2_12_FULL_49_11]
MKKKPDTSWENVADWYDKIVGKEGHDYHRTLIYPKLQKSLNKAETVLDIGSGNGSLRAILPENTDYIGIDASKTLINNAPKDARSRFIVHDMMKPIPEKLQADAIYVILSLQNMQDPYLVLRHIAACSKKGAHIHIVLNHPAFRIPRQSSWGIDSDKDLQYRRIDRYFSPMEIPITMHPSKKQGPETTSFHFPVSVYVQALIDAGFKLEKFEEWLSPKQSSGKTGKRENRARNEFPLFLFLKGVFV